MKTLLLEIDDRDYATILAFIKLLPETHCRILEEDMLSEEERQYIQASHKFSKGRVYDAMFIHPTINFIV